MAQTAVESEDREECVEDLETCKARQHKVIAESQLHRGVETGVDLWSTHGVTSWFGSTVELSFRLDQENSSDIDWQVT